MERNHELERREVEEKQFMWIKSQRIWGISQIKGFKTKKINGCEKK